MLGCKGVSESSVPPSYEDLAALALAVTEYLMMARACPCVHVTTAALPTGMRDGPTCAEGAG